MQDTPNATIERDILIRNLLLPSDGIKQEILTTLATFKQEDGRFPLDAEFYAQMKPYTTSGKFFRGCMMLVMYPALSDSSHLPGAVTVAAALELLCSGLLVKDDIMDLDTRRRGQPTIHTTLAVWAEQQSITGSDHFSKSIAMCFGDILFFLGTRLLAQADIPAEQKVRLLEVASKELALLGLAQSEDMRLASIPIEAVSKQEIIAMQYAKTGRYTGRWPLVSVGILTDRPEAELIQLAEIGDEIGLLYQWRDDYLGILGNPANTGKNTISDVVEGKKTLYYWYAVQQLTGTKNEAILKTFGSKASSEKVAELVALLDETGITKLVNDEFFAHQETIAKKIAKSTLSRAAKALLLQITTVVVTREK